MSDRVDRRAELERKKARLAQIRAEKQNKASRKEVSCDLCCCLYEKILVMLTAY